MPSKRVIACLDVRHGRVVKGVQYRDHVDVGDPAERAARYCEDGADEIVVYDIAASAEGRAIDCAWIADIARRIDVPLTVAGGVRTIERAIACLENGADKVSINSPALERPAFITDLARVAGSQCVVVGVDSRRVGGEWRPHQYAGVEAATRVAARSTMDWIVEAEDRGAGEIVLNCMDQDGVRRGYDIEQLKEARRRLRIPLVASGGAGAASHFVEVFEKADVSGALAAGVFHAEATTIAAVKHALADAGLEVRR